MSPGTGRAPYEPAPKRPRLTLPGGSRLAVHVAVNVEDWHYEEKMPRIVLPAPRAYEPISTVPNFAWYSYGMRRDQRRTLDLFAESSERATLSLNASVCDTYPEIVEATERAGWEIMGHAASTRHVDAARRRRTRDRARSARPRRARHRQAPARVARPGTRGVVRNRRYTGVGGAHLLLRLGCGGRPAVRPHGVATGRLVSVPYAVEMNDVVMYGVEKRPDEVMLERGRRHFDRLYAESATQAKVMAIALHPWITGVPHRIGYLEELLRYIAAKPGTVFMTAGEIADWYGAASAAGRLP